MSTSTLSQTLYWKGTGNEHHSPLSASLLNLHDNLFVLSDNQGHLVTTSQGSVSNQATPESKPLKAYLPSCLPQNLGSATFLKDHGLKYPYVAGAMANGICSEEIVESMAREGMLGFFGSAGLPLPRVEQAIERLQKNLGDLPFGSNLIHSPNEPDLEMGVVDLYLRKGVRRISASAYLRLTLPIVKYRLAGIRRLPDGSIDVPNKIFAKISRTEVATRFLSPAPEKIVQELVQQGFLTAEQAMLAKEVPMADDITAESDSGGHTDNRPSLALFPTIVALRNNLQKQYNYRTAPRVGAAGSIGTPDAAAAYFAAGADYIITGSINQACVESGSSDTVREILCKAKQADVTMAPAADMFEMGVNVQVLKFGTMFPVRARKLYELYRAYPSLELIPADERKTLETQFFKRTLEEEWQSTHDFFAQRDPRQNERAAQDPKHKMALVFRSYLGQSSRWANAGIPERKMDYQIWCGAAMGAFNEWVKGTFLEPPQARTVATVAYNILYGAALQIRLSNLQFQGVHLPHDQKRIIPQTESFIKAQLTKGDR